MSDLGKIIETLAELPADMVFPHGFAHSHSYRGYYDQLAFEPATNTRAGDMLAAAQSALGKTYTGYKGGDYEMHSWTECWLAEYGDTGEALNIDALVTIAKRREQADALAEVARQARDVLNEWVTEDGGCDHAVGICNCSIYNLIGDIDTALRAYTEASHE